MSGHNHKTHDASTLRSVLIRTAAAFLVLLLCSPVAALAQTGDAESADPSDPSEKTAAPDLEVLTITVPVKPGDRCIVCGTLLQSGHKVYLVEGQRVGIMPMMEPELRADPWAFIARLKPRGGLFGGEVAPGSAVSDVWLLLGIYVTVGLAFSAVCAHRALNIGQAPAPWFFAGLFFNAFGYLALLLRSASPEAAAAPKYTGVVKIPATAEPQACPTCGAENHPSATSCLRCGSDLAPLTSSEVTRMQTGSN